MRIYDRQPAWTLLFAGVMLIVGAMIVGLTQVVSIEPQPTLAAAPQAPASSIPAPSAPSQPLNPSCLEDLPPWYQAYAEGKEEPNNFGPSADIGNTGSILAEFERRLCGDQFTGGDKRLAVAVHAAAYGHSPNTAVTRLGWERMVSEITDNIVSARVVNWTPPQGSKTMYMTKGANPSVDPYVGIDDAASVESKYLVLTFARPAGGTMTVYLRIACGFQPTGPGMSKLVALLSRVIE